MIPQILRFSIKHRLFVILSAGLIALLGALALRELPIDVYPDPSPPLVQIYTESEGMAPEEIERLISFPMESAMFGLPRVKNIRSFSTFGLSIVNVYFEDGTDIYWARQLVSQRVQEVGDHIPEQAHRPVLGPIATGLGMVYLYYLEGEGYSAMELRTVQDWLIKYELKSVPEVSQVLSIGGDVRQFQVLARPALLLKYDLTISDLAASLRRNNRNAGASFITRGREEFVVRSVGLAGTVEDLENIVVAQEHGTAVFLRDVASVRILPAVRRGAAMVDGRGERVVGMVLKLFGSNTDRVIRDIEKRISEINRSLPEGVRIVPFYNQAALVKKCFSTVSTSLVLGIVLVIVVLFLFMGHFPSSVIAVLSLPFSILFSFIVMGRINLSADLISFGGFAIGIGLIADAAIILVENIHRHVQISPRDRTAAILAAGREVGRPLFFAVAIIILVFLPIFTLTGVEGIMFRPMGFTISLALAGSLVFTLFVVPALASLRIGKRKPTPAREPRSIRSIKSAYLRLFEWSRAHRRPVLIGTGLLLLSGMAILPFMGSEYLPTLEEGTLHMRATFDPNISLEETIEQAGAIEKTLIDIPEITGILTRIGRGEVGSHAHFVNDAEILIQLQPLRKWKRLRNKDMLIHDIEHALDKFPGINLNMTQPIAHNLDELLTGVKAQLAVKLYGSDFTVLRDRAVRIKEELGSVKGAADVQVEQFTGQNHVEIFLKRERLARHGVDISDVQDTIEAALGGITVGQIFDEQKRFDIFLRYASRFRNDIDLIQGLRIRTPAGGQVPLRQLAEVRETVGPRHIGREGNRRYITIQCNVRGRDMGSFVQEARKLIESRVSLPPEYMLKWGGQFELQQRANRRLALIMPVTLTLVVLLLFTIFYSFREVLIILVNIPLALTGGIIALKLGGLYMSVPASIGFIAIMGVALEDGLVLLSAFRRRLSEGGTVPDAVRFGIEIKLRPVLMTTFTTIFGVLPLLLSRGPGAEIQRPLATVVTGGLLTSTLVTLVVLPLIFEIVQTRWGRVSEDG